MARTIRVARGGPLINPTTQTMTPAIASKVTRWFKPDKGRNFLYHPYTQILDEGVTSHYFYEKAQR
jgi:hypothetical protein